MVIYIQQNGGYTATIDLTVDFQTQLKARVRVQSIWKKSCHSPVSSSFLEVQRKLTLFTGSQVTLDLPDTFAGKRTRQQLSQDRSQISGPSAATQRQAPWWPWKHIRKQDLPRPAFV